MPAEVTKRVSEIGDIVGVLETWEATNAVRGRNWKKRTRKRITRFTPRVQTQFEDTGQHHTMWLPASRLASAAKKCVLSVAQCFGQRPMMFGRPFAWLIQAPPNN